MSLIIDTYTESGHGSRGVKPIDKRDGAGPHNWGSTKDVIEYVLLFYQLLSLFLDVCYIFREADRPNEADQSWGEEPKPETTETEKK